MRRSTLCLLYLLSLLVFASPTSVRADEAIAMHGDPKYGEGFLHFDYVNSEAPKGGTLRLSHIGSYDSLNPYIIHGVPAQGRHLVFESLMQRSADEPFSLYGLLAERIETAPDRSWVEFYLNPKARFHDGKPVTIEDVIFSLETLRDHGRPNHHAYYSKVSKIERIGQHGIRFTFSGETDRELPLIIGLMPVLPRHFFANKSLEQIKLDPITGSGPYQVEIVDAGRSIAYRRVGSYWGKDLPVAQGRHNFERIVYDYFRDNNAAQEAFRSSSIDLQAEPRPERWATAYNFDAVKQGKVIKAEISHGRPSGMRAFVMNGRKSFFTDIRVRKALLLAFHFEWANKYLFHDGYIRTESYFGGTDLAAPPELTLAEQSLLDEINSTSTNLSEPIAPMPTASDKENRANAVRAMNLLQEAGWRIVDGALVDEKARPFAFEILLVNPANTRLAQQYARDLARLGITANVRLVDSAQYQERTAVYDFDMIIYAWGQSLSPGNEQAFYWGSKAADQQGTRNYMGVRDPLIDAIIQAQLRAITREELVTATRLLDRTLRQGLYVIPLFHQPTDKVAYWNHLQRPAKTPVLGYSLDSWWYDPVKK